MSVYYTTHIKIEDIDEDLFLRVVNEANDIRSHEPNGSPLYMSKVQGFDIEKRSLTLVSDMKYFCPDLKDQTIQILGDRIVEVEVWADCDPYTIHYSKFKGNECLERREIQLPQDA